MTFNLKKIILVLLFQLGPTDVALTLPLKVMILTHLNQHSQRVLSHKFQLF